MKPATSVLDLAAIRAQFPGLNREVHGHPLVYLDSAATAQRCTAALAAMDHYHRSCNANVHRGLYTTAEEATSAYEAARHQIARLLGVQDADQLVFTRGTTEAVNLVARGFLAPRLEAGDEILVTTMEHHSNLVPWQMVAQERGATIVAVDITPAGELDLEDLHAKLGERTRMLAVSHASNVLGTINPVRSIVEIAHRRGVPVFIDGAQAVPHLRLDLDALGADFYAFSGHKVYGPTGSGALYGRSDHLEAMVPLFGGGDMIREVRIEGSTYADPPQRFEAGTPNIAAMIGLGAAAEWFGGLDLHALEEYEASLLGRTLDGLEQLGGVRVFGRSQDRIAVFGFEVEGLSAQDIATLLDQEAIALRTGHHCAQPLMRVLGITGCLRVSIAPYNTIEEIDRFLAALKKVCRVLRGGA